MSQPGGHADAQRQESPHDHEQCLLRAADAVVVVGLGRLAWGVAARTDGAVLAGVALAAVVDLAGALLTQTRAARPRAPRPPPTLLVLGSANHLVFLVEAYDRALRAVGVPGRLIEVPHADHVFDVPFGSPGARLTRPAVAAFRAEHVGVPAR